MTIKTFPIQTVDATAFLTSAQAAEVNAVAAAAQAALYDGPWLDTASALFVDTTLTYSAGSGGSVGAGNIVRTRAEGLAYEVAAPSATDHHVATAGGVKLYVLPSRDGYNVKAFGAAGDGLADDTGAFATAASKSPHVHVPRGTYRLAADVTGPWDFGPGVYFTGGGIARKANLSINRSGKEAANTRAIDTRSYVYGQITQALENFHSVNSFQVNDVADITGAGNLMSGTQFVHVVGPGAKGSRSAAHARIQVGARGPDIGSQVLADDVAFSSTGYSSANQGGNGVIVSGYVDQGYMGSLFGGNDHVWLTGAATNYRLLCGREINVHMLSGASSYAKVGLFIVEKDVSAGRAVEDDAGIAIGGEGPSSWRHGIQFGWTWGEWHFSNDSTLIGAVRRKYPTINAASMDAAYGVDFREVNFSQSAFVSNGFSVDGDGDVSAKSYSSQSVYHVGTDQVVGPRKTGWAVATGSANREAFDTSTVTLPQLAERLKALIDDLTSHGLIGPQPE